MIFLVQFGINKHSQIFHSNCTRPTGFFVVLITYTKDIVIEVNKLLFKFSWKGKDKVKRLSLIRGLDKGGLKERHLESTDKKVKGLCVVRNLPRINKVIGKIILSHYMKNVGWKLILRWAVDKIRNMEHSGTSRNILEHPGTFRNIPERGIIVIIMRKVCKIKLSTIKWSKNKLVSAWKIKRKKNRTKQNKTKTKTNWKKNQNWKCVHWVKARNPFLSVRFAINLIACCPLFLMSLFIENQASGIRIIGLWFLY